MIIPMYLMRNSSSCTSLIIRDYKKNVAIEKHGQNIRERQATANKLSPFWMYKRYALWYICSINFNL